jgi:hypothetical protein
MQESNAPTPGYQPLKPEPHPAWQEPGAKNGQPAPAEAFDYSSAVEPAPSPQAAPPPAPEPAVEEVEEDLLSHVLSKPIEAHGEIITILKWREPTGGDIERAGNPIVLEGFGDKPRVVFDEKKMGAMISQLASIPPSSVKALQARDWNAIAFKVFRFFM